VRPRATSRLQLECPEVADLLGANSAVEANLSGARQHAINDSEYAGVALVNVRAAGNDGVALSSMADHIDCPSDERNVPLGAGSVDVMVGSTGATSAGTQAYSEFTNSGPCVAYYAPGEHVITMSPGGFLAVVSGTSFSAPLVVRRLSLLPPGTTPAAMIETLQGPFVALPVEGFPAELFYDIGPATRELAF
jgi:hypothetical protein